ncbi:hypothetical protein GCM10010423_29740 [Streptomyces levis]|uniref:Uncharacterized protein n=1 Tax=Streptomyces levis TaxID=285566 RepID=A0ABP6B3U0_9ACTN
MAMKGTTARTSWNAPCAPRGALFAHHGHPDAEPGPPWRPWKTSAATTTLQWWASVGIAGGIHDDHARIGNVIASTDAVTYENRKLNPQDTRRRGEHRQV